MHTLPLNFPTVFHC